jgi:hypothetical protein
VDNGKRLHAPAGKNGRGIFYSLKIKNVKEL